jgi:hypothetical protein
MQASQILPFPKNEQADNNHRAFAKDKAEVGRQAKTLKLKKDNSWLLIGWLPYHFPLFVYITH